MQMKKNINIPGLNLLSTKILKKIVKVLNKY